MHDRPADEGAVDVSVQMLFGFVALLFALLLVFEAVAYWHARNVYDEAAVEGARVAAANDGTCADGTTAARAVLSRVAGAWADGAEIACIDGATVTVTVSGHTPGVLTGGLGFEVRVVESAPKER